MVDSKSIVAFGGDVFTRGSVVVANLAKVSISSTDASFLARLTILETLLYRLRVPCYSAVTGRYWYRLLVRQRGLFWR